MSENLGSQFFGTTTGIKSGPDSFDESKFVMTFLIILRFVLEGEMGTEIPIVCIPSLSYRSGGAGGRVEPPPTFSKKGGSAQPQVLEGGAFFLEGGRGCNFHIKKSKSQIFNGQKSL